MKRTPLTRKTPLKARKGLRKTVQNRGKQPNSKAGLRRAGIITRKPSKNSTLIPEATKQFILNRSGGKCELPGCHREDFRGLQFAHIEHRGMGGRKGKMIAIIHDPRNVVLVCAVIHDIIDGRAKSDSLFRQYVIEILKKISDWDSWATEFKNDRL
jgi:hypothetical protein